jgi:hypothetical protein
MIVRHTGFQEVGVEPGKAMRVCTTPKCPGSNR